MVSSYTGGYYSNNNIIMLGCVRDSIAKGSLHRLYRIIAPIIRVSQDQTRCFRILLQSCNNREREREDSYLKKGKGSHYARPRPPPPRALYLASSIYVTAALDFTNHLREIPGVKIRLSKGLIFAVCALVYV